MKKTYPFVDIRLLDVRSASLEVLSDRPSVHKDISLDDTNGLSTCDSREQSVAVRHHARE